MSDYESAYSSLKIVNELKKENASIRAEIERKDKLIEEAFNQLFVDQDGIGSISDARRLLNQVLSNNEVSDER
jgi:predicted KAP-like P-loop ATPase